MRARNAMLAAALTFALAIVSSAVANYNTTNANGQLVPIKSITLGDAVTQLPQSVPSDSTGNAYTNLSPLPVYQPLALPAGPNVIGGVTQSGAWNVTPLGAASTDGSGTVATGNTFQTLFASSGTRKGCAIQNPITATEILYVNIGVLGSATTAKSYTLTPGSSFSCAVAGDLVVTDAINVTAATTAHAFVATRY